MILYTDPEATYQSMISVYDVLAGTGVENSQHSFKVTDIAVPTQRDIEEYIDLFGANPFEVACS